MTTTTTKTRRAIDFTCPECGARPGRPCKGSRIPSCNTLGGGWGGPVDRKRPHDARYAARRAWLAAQSAPIAEPVADEKHDGRCTFVATVKTEDGTSTHTIKAADMRGARDWIFEIFPGISSRDFDVVWAPRVGDGAHSSINGDAYPFTVVEVSASGHRVVARRDRVARITDGLGAYVEGERDALFTVDPEGERVVFMRRKRGGYSERGVSYVRFAAGRKTAYNPHV